MIFSPFLGSRSASRENGNSDLLLISFFSHSCFLFSCSLTEGGQNSEAWKSSTHHFPSLPSPSPTSQQGHWGLEPSQSDRWQKHSSGSRRSEARLLCSPLWVSWECPPGGGGGRGVPHPPTVPVVGLCSPWVCPAQAVRLTECRHSSPGVKGRVQWTEAGSDQPCLCQLCVFGRWPDLPGA